jgi:hypothetical protein
LSHGFFGPLALMQCTHCRLHQVPVSCTHSVDK